MQGVCTMSVHGRGRGQAGCLQKVAAAHLLPPTASLSVLFPKRADDEQKGETFPRL